MGLDTTHDCWHGPYSSFMKWREKICEIAGYGNINDREGFYTKFDWHRGGTKKAVPWPSYESDALIILLHHSDCDDDISHTDCEAIADRLEECLPSVRRADHGNIIYPNYFENKTKEFIKGLRNASAMKENVIFG